MESATSTFYRRPLPDNLIPFASPEGRRLFQEALAAGGMEGWFALAEQFHTQSDPAFCGLGSLVVVLNALQIDPGRIWKGPWRWYSEELLDCCLSLDQVRGRGVTLTELCCLARCNGATAKARHAEASSVEDLRSAIAAATSSSRGPVMIAAYSRRLLGQTGDGHYSPVAGYHGERDLVLVLDVARFKYPPHWVPVPLLFEAMQPADPQTGRSRGWAMFERSESPSATLFRIATPDQAAAIAEGLFSDGNDQLPREATALLRAFDARLGLTLQRWLAQMLAAPEDVREEHARAITDIRTQIRSTRLFSKVQAGLGVASGQEGEMRREALCMLLLALPEEEVCAWGLPQEILELRALPQHDVTALAGEVAALRAQIQTLRIWQGRR